MLGISGWLCWVFQAGCAGYFRLVVLGISGWLCWVFQAGCAGYFRLEYEQSRLLGRIEELVSTFDAELRILRHQKFKLDIVMKNADLR